MITEVSCLYFHVYIFGIGKSSLSIGNFCSQFLFLNFNFMHICFFCFLLCYTWYGILINLLHSPIGSLKFPFIYLCIYLTSKVKGLRDRIRERSSIHWFDPELSTSMQCLWLGQAEAGNQEPSPAFS